MDVWHSNVNPNSPEFKEKYAAMALLISELERETEKSLFQGEDKYLERAHKAGKLLARERIERVLDEDTPFLELLPLAGCRDKQNVTSVCGIGVISGVECLISSNIYTIKGGAINEPTLRKGGRVNDIINQNRLPSVTFVETGGANLTQQSKVFHSGGGAFKELARRSKRGIPSIAIVFGSSTAGGAYTPGMSDYTVMVKNQARVFLAGPPLVKAAISEEVDAETLGGAEMHSKVSGVSDYLAQDEETALALCRRVIANLNYKKEEPFPASHLVPHIKPPIYDPDQILGIVGADLRSAFDAREVIARIVDGSSFHEWKPDFAQTLVCCYANIHGFTLGILANNGVLFSDTANKGAHFIQICDKRGIPLLFLQNITGFMVGTKQERDGIIKHGSKLINAVSNAAVPSITVIIGASYGAGNYAMMGRAYEPRFLFTWPNSKVAVMGSDQLVGVMETVAMDAAKKDGKEYDHEKAKVVNKMFKERVDAESNVYNITSECLDDGILDPRDTRDVLGICLSVIYNNKIEKGGMYGISRL